MEKEQARYYIKKNWKQFKDLNLKQFKYDLHEKCLPFDEKKLSEWFRQKVYNEKKKEEKMLGSGAFVSKNTSDESVFITETHAQKQARLVTKAMIEADTNQQSLVVDQVGKRETQIQTRAFFEEHKTPKQNTKEHQIDSPISSQDSQSSKEKSNIFALKLSAQGSQSWLIMKDIKKTNNFQEFWQLKLDLDLAMCALIVFRRTLPQNNDHVKIISASIGLFQNNGQTIPHELTRFYEQFFKYLTLDKFKQLKLENLKPLFKFCREINADINWLKQIEDPFILFDFASVKGAAEAVHLLLKFKTRYSLKYFFFIDQIIHNRVYASMVKDFSCLLSFSALIFDISWKKALCQFSNIVNRERDYNDIKSMAVALLDDNKNEIEFSKLMIVLEVVLENHNIDDTKLFLGWSFSSKEELKYLIENSMKAATMHDVKRDELAKEDQIKKDLADKQKIENDKKEKTEKEARAKKKIQERQQYQQDLVVAETQFKKANTTDQGQFKSKELQVLFEKDLKELSKTMKVILGKLKLKLRAEQVVVLNLLLRSNRKFTFIQLGTGFGKSKGIIGPLSDAVRWATGAKSIVIVPTRILRATNQEYCIEANQAEIELTDPNCVGTFYCTYEQFLRLQHMIPTKSNIFVDEGHLYFKEKVIQVEKKAVVPAEILKKFARVYILSATFGGQQGIAELQRYLKDSLFIQSSAEMSQKDLSQIQVVGNMQSREQILVKAVEVAKLQLKEYPVILFCKDDSECISVRGNFEKARIFGEGSDTAELLDIIKSSKSISNEQVILTTQKACVGIDFIFKVLRAFVVLTEDANYLEELLQPVGRSSRVDQSLPLLGAILTSIDCQDIASLEKSLKDKAAEIKLFGETARVNMSLLDICPSATQKQQKKLQHIIDMFNVNPSNVDIKKELQSMKGFKEPIEEHLRQNKKEMFASMITKDTNVMEVQPIASLLELYQICAKDLVLAEDSDFDEPITLGKRIQRIEHQENDCTQQAMKCVKLNEEQWEDVWMKEEQEKSAFQWMLDEQPTEFQMDPQALKQKELDEAAVVFAKHGTKPPELGQNLIIQPKSVRSYKNELFKPRFEAKNLIKSENFMPSRVDNQQLGDSAQILLGKRVKDSDLNDSNYSSSNEAQFIKRQKVNQNPQLNVEMQEIQDQGDTFLTNEEQEQILQGKYQPDQHEIRENQIHEFQMDPEAIKHKEVNEARSTLEKYGIKVQEISNQEFFAKPQSVLSFDSARKAKTNLSERDLSGRFKQKYKIGEKAADGSIIKKVVEDDWEFVEKDKNWNSYYKCLNCNKATRVLKGDRKKHKCKK